MNESLQKPWLLVIEASERRLPEYGYTVCGFNTRGLAERQRKRLESLRSALAKGRIEADAEVTMPDGNIVFAGDIGPLHLFQRCESTP